MDLNALLLFAKVVEANSFSGAARRLGMPVSTLSRRVAELEDQLSARLLERSTRSLRLTAIGGEVLEHARRSVEIGEAVDAVVSDRMAEIAGLLRLSAPPSISDSLLAPLIEAFQAAHPAARVQVFVTERLIDHVAEGIDLSFHVGRLRDSSLVARRILTYRHRLVASPAYLARAGAPSRPQDLLAHRMLAFSHGRAEARWPLRHVDGAQSERLAFVPHLAMNDFAGLAAALVAGAGIGDLPPVVQPELLRDGRLVEVMPDWRFPVFDLSVVHLGSRHVPRAVRVFKDLAARIGPALFPDLPL